jgi:hypothetical protein
LALEDSTDPGELLGFSFNTGITTDNMFDPLLQQLRARLCKWETFPLTLQGVIVANYHLISSGLWDVLTLNATKADRLKKIQALINNFNWNGCQEKVKHQVAANIIILPKSQDELGLLDVNQQDKVRGTQMLL